MVCKAPVRYFVNARLEEITILYVLLMRFVSLAKIRVFEVKFDFATARLDRELQASCRVISKLHSEGVLLLAE